MAEGPKPYRVYRGGRVRGKVPSPAAEPAERRDRSDGDGRQRAPKAGPPRDWRRYTKWAALGFAGFAVLVFIWLVASYFSVGSGVSTANKRLPGSVRAALTHKGGLLLSSASDFLVLGTDHATGNGRAADEHSDSIMLVRTDPSHHRIVYLTIPRDLRVEIPGYGTAKANFAFQQGGPALAIRMVQSLTGLPVNHVVIVDFSRFQELIDRVGGVTIDVPRPILSNRFDCPYATEARCGQWPGWRFRKGKQHMDGHRALIYSRVRENRLDPSESDVTRGERQQQVLQALASKLASIGTLVKLPFDGGDLMKPLATDLSTWQLLQLGWVKFRTPGGRVLHCRLGGTPTTDPRLGSVIAGSEENVAVVHMVTGDSAPQPPPPGSGSFGPGCVAGSRSLAGA